MIKNNLSTFFKTAEKQDLNEKVLFIDFHNLVFRTLFAANSKASKDLLSTQEMYSWWRYLMFNNILNNIKHIKPTRVIVAIDSPDSWRKEIYVKYKANRKQDREKSIVDFKEFWPILEEFLQEFESTFSNVVVMKVDKCEGDDIIAVLTKEELSNNKKIHIITTDKDFIQLLKYQDVVLFNPIKRKEVKSLNPIKDLELKVVSGDLGDNIPSIKKRIGPKTAVKMINEGIEKYINEDKEMSENYIRNKKIIDFDLIPEEIKNNIKNKYKTISPKPIIINNLLKFLVKCNIQKIIEDLQQYIPSLKNIS